MSEECTVLEPEQLFSLPVQADVVDNLIACYQSDLRDIDAIVGFMESQGNKVLRYFSEGSELHAGYGRQHVATAFKRDWAIAALNADYWSRAILLTDVLNVMPQKRRDEWHKSIREHTTPEFCEETVRATLMHLIMSREQFFSERVEGIFRALSGEHVTNSPAGFRKRMVISFIFDGFGNLSHSKAGYINDLRVVVAKFMGRDEPDWYLTFRSLDRIPKNGQWHLLDGGSIRIRLYKKGTGHLEIHPDMAWRLNCVLAAMYPNAIPSEFRKKPSKPHKDFVLLQRPLPFQILSVLICLAKGRQGWSRIMESSANAEVKKQAGDVLNALGGVDIGHGTFEFDYDPTDAINFVLLAGCIPDHRSHQYYPTPLSLATKAVELAGIPESAVCLEPSAGQGGLADLLPKANTDCVEISALHCKILESKGLSVSNADFLSWDAKGKKYDRCVMNPPFNEGRWRTHVETAADHIKAGGRLVAILPASASSFTLSGFDCAHHGPFANEFAGTSISVVILVANKRC